MTPADTTTKALIAEDEVPQRVELVDLLARAWPELEIVATCDDGISALQAIAGHRPQVAFLDVRMPGVGGLDVAKAAVAAGAAVVFTTAYDEYAVRAFEAGAVDYLLKPVQPQRLEQCVARLRALMRQPPAPADLRARIDGLEASLRPRGDRLIRWIGAGVGDSVRMIGIDEVLYFQARHKYVSVVTGDGEAVIRTPIKELLAGLDPDLFWQVHRGTIVRVSAIERMQKDAFGKYGIRLRRRDEWLPVSEAFAHRFKAM